MKRLVEHRVLSSPNSRCIVSGCECCWLLVDHRKSIRRAASTEPSVFFTPQLDDTTQRFQAIVNKSMSPMKSGQSALCLNLDQATGSIVPFHAMYLAKQNGFSCHIWYDAPDLRNCQLPQHIQVKTKLLQSWTPVSKEYSGQIYGFVLYNGHVVNVRWTVIFHKSLHKLCKMSDDHQSKYLFLQCFGFWVPT